jgi:hypothetical protein
MAASAITLFPDISILITVNLDSYFRTHRRAYGAAVAFLFFIRADRVIAVRIVFFCGNNMTLGAKMNAEQAFFTDFFVNLNISLQNESPIF